MNTQVKLACPHCGALNSFQFETINSLIGELARCHECKHMSKFAIINADGPRFGLEKVDTDAFANVLNFTTDPEPACSCQFCTELMQVKARVRELGWEVIDNGSSISILLKSPVDAQPDAQPETSPPRAADAKDWGEQPTVPEILQQAAHTFESRNSTYGGAYKTMGPLLAALFPDGLTLKTPEQWARFGVFFMLIGKLARYAPSLATGGHEDSALDSVAYAAMLTELTERCPF